MHDSTGDFSSIESLKCELDNLKEEYDALTIAYKKQTRALNLAEKQIERNKIGAAAKDNLSKVVSAKRSELERYMNLLLGNCPDIILLFNQDNKIAYCTNSFLSNCEIPSFGIIRGTSYVDLLSPYGSEEFRPQLQKAFAEAFREEKTVEFTAMLDFGNHENFRNYTVQVTPMIGDAEHADAEGAMAIFTDMTEVLRAQHDAERANMAKSDFLATVSHEIRTPMNAIIGVSNMLKDTGLDDTQKSYLQNIQTSSHTLLTLINDILDFSKIEAGKLELVEDYFKLPALLKHLETMFELMFQQKGLYFVCEFSDDLPEIVYGDDKRITQILTNILNNALKYTPEGSVHFYASVEANGSLNFSILDTGIGIKEEAIPRLFSAFEQLDLARNKGVVGTGLGLAITKRLCDLMGGSISVESTYGEGSHFTINLPLPVGTEADLPTSFKKASFQFKAPDAKVLIVDDIEINIQITEYMLETYEIKTDSAPNGLIAIEKVRNNHYDLVLMDHMMPEMDGMEATNTIRKIDGWSAQVPIIALTANAVSGAVTEFLNNGFNDFLSKPIDDNALSECLLRWLPKDKIQNENASAK